MSFFRVLTRQKVSTNRALASILEYHDHLIFNVILTITLKTKHLYVSILETDNPRGLIFENFQLFQGFFKVKVYYHKSVLTLRLGVGTLIVLKFLGVLYIVRVT